MPLQGTCHCKHSFLRRSIPRRVGISRNSAWELIRPRSLMISTGSRRLVFCMDPTAFFGQDPCGGTFFCAQLLAAITLIRNGYHSGNDEQDRSRNAHPPTPYIVPCSSSLFFPVIDRELPTGHHTHTRILYIQYTSESKAH